jgi:hypothetical protein
MLVRFLAGSDLLCSIWNHDQVNIVHLPLPASRYLVNPCVDASQNNTE